MRRHVDEVNVGSHLASIDQISNSLLYKTRYSLIFDVRLVVQSRRRIGPNRGLSFKKLILKATMLLTLKDHHTPLTCPG